MDAPALPDGALRAVFLDAGGTLIHLDWGFLAGTLDAVGIQRSRADLEAAFDAARSALTTFMIERPNADTTERAAVMWRTLLDRSGCAGEVAAAVEARVRAHEDDGLLWSHVEPGTLETLRALRSRGLTVGVVSNSDGRVESFLREAGLTEHLDFVVDSGRVGVEKPDPRIFAIACREAGVGPREAVHVGDIYDIDILGARAAGIPAILLSTAGAPPNDAGCPTLRALSDLPGRLLPSPGQA